MSKKFCIADIEKIMGNSSPDKGQKIYGYYMKTGFTDNSKKVKRFPMSLNQMYGGKEVFADIEK